MSENYKKTEVGFNSDDWDYLKTKHIAVSSLARQLIAEYVIELKLADEVIKNIGKEVQS